MPAQTAAAQGQPVLERSRPRLAIDAKDHGATGASRNDAARAATATASTASANTEPVGAIGANNGSSPCANTVNHARIASAFAPKRRNQPRTVEAGAPTRTAAAR